jgi:hypothetical protein
MKSSIFVTKRRLLHRLSHFFGKDSHFSPIMQDEVKIKVIVVGFPEISIKMHHY